MNTEAQARLSEIRSQLGIGPGPRRHRPPPADTGGETSRPDPGAEPPARAGRGRPPRLTAYGAAQGRTTRSSRWMTSWGTPVGEVGGAPPGDRRERRRPAIRTRPLANTRPSGPATSTASSASKRPVDLDDAGRQQRDVALDERPPGAVVDDDGARRADGERDPQLAGRQALRSRGSTTVPTPGAPATASASTPGAVGGGDDRAHARPGGDLGRRQLRGHAAAPPGRAGAAGHAPRARGRPRRSPR